MEQIKCEQCGSELDKKGDELHCPECYSFFCKDKREVTGWTFGGGNVPDDVLLIERLRTVRRNIQKIIKNVDKPPCFCYFSI